MSNNTSDEFAKFTESYTQMVKSMEKIAASMGYALVSPDALRNNADKIYEDNGPQAFSFEDDPIAHTLKLLADDLEKRIGDAKND